MSAKQSIPHGLWPSQLSPEWIGDLREFSELCWGPDGRLFWIERHSNRSGLYSWQPQNGAVSLLSNQSNLSGGIMYGGGSYVVDRDQAIWIEKGSHQLYRQPESALTPQKIPSSTHPKASPLLSPAGNLLVFIESDGRQDAILAHDLAGKQSCQVLDTSPGFYNYLRWHPSGSKLAWVGWEHPHMPWDRADLYLAEIRGSAEGQISLGLKAPLSSRTGCSHQQPVFSADGQHLAYISDQSGWWQIYLYNLDSGEHRQLTFEKADHGLPPWLQNQYTLGFSPDSRRIYFIRNRLGFASLWQLDIVKGQESPLPLDPHYTWLESLAVSPAADQIALVASGSRIMPEIITLAPGGDCQIIRRSSREELPRELFSIPEAITWQGRDSESIHGLFYQPTNPECESDGLPPLLIIIHSGPTRQKYAEFQPRTQYFTSRGYAVLEVNYRGSSGYGRRYWESLKGRWGVLDVSDVCQALGGLSGRSLFDPDRVAVLGSSSGGLTVLQLMVNYPGVFKAGISLYGITNLRSLEKNPPKFERFYTAWLAGRHFLRPLVYQRRSPLFSAHKIRDPIAIFQGGRDPIVPREQAEQIVKALQRNHIPHQYHLYPEEGHGFKKSENVSDFYQKTAAFLQKHVIPAQEQSAE